MVQSNCTVFYLFIYFRLTCIYKSLHVFTCIHLRPHSKSMLIIYAHPNKEGHCGYFLEQTKKQLQKNEVDFEILDLYEMNYDPVLKNEEHYTSGKKNIDDVNLQIQEKIKQNDKLIFIYPTWWNSLPAILKGFLDKVFTGGFAFKYTGKIPTPLLQNKAVIFTTSGAPRIYSRLVGRSRSIKVLKDDTLKFCGIKSKAFAVGNGNKLTDKNKKKIESQVVKGLNYLK
jgi:NAD(P)H dehydrogenase (quinone)